MGRAAIHDAHIPVSGDGTPRSLAWYANDSTHAREEFRRNAVDSILAGNWSSGVPTWNGSFDKDPGCPSRSWIPWGDEVMGSPDEETRMAPQDGDIVVTRESQPPESRSSLRFIVCQLPNSGQLSASTRDQAVRLARGFAQKNAVDVWYCDQGAFRLLEAYRVRTTTRARPARSA